MEQQPKQQEWLGLVEGDGEIWRVFLERLIPRLYGTFLKSWPNPSLAEELVQKTVFDAVRGRNTYDPEKGSAEEWLFGIARNNIRLEIRKRAGRPGVNGDISDYVDLLDAEPLPDELLERKETAVLVRTALSQLDDREQMVLRAKYIEGLSAAQIAKRLEVTEKAVHNLLYRARNSIRERLKGASRADKQE